MRHAVMLLFILTVSRCLPWRPPFAPCPASAPSGRCGTGISL